MTMKKILLPLVLLLLAPLGVRATQNPVLCEAGFYCPAAAGGHVQCTGNEYCPRTGMSAPEQCPQGVVCENGLAARCQPGFANTAAEGQTPTCTSCPRGNRCPQGSAEQCTPGTYQDEEGKLECKACTAGMTSGQGATQCTACAAGQRAVGNSCEDCPIWTHSATAGATACTACAAGTVPNRTSMATACIAGTMSSMGALGNGTTLQPGAYRFTLSGGGGGGGASACSNCGYSAASCGGGRGQRVITDIVALEAPASVQVAIGRGGRGTKYRGYGTNDDGVECTYSCNSLATAECANGGDGGTTTLTIAGASGSPWTASGGTGGKSKVWRFVNKTGNTYAPCPALAVNGDGSVGGAGHTNDIYHGEGNPGTIGYITYEAMTIPN